MGRLKDLAKEHSDHTVMYESKDDASEELDRALEIYSSIGTRIGKIGNLYKSNTGSDNAFSDDNAIMGILAKLLGFDDDANKIYEGLGQMKDNDLVSTLTGSNVYRTDANAYYSVFCGMLGKRSEAKVTRRKIITEIGKLSNGLYAEHLIEHKDGTRYSGGCGKTIHNASMAVLEAALGHSEADALYDKIGDVAGKEGVLYMSDPDSFVKCEDNIAMVVVCELLGKCEEADSIFNSLEAVYGIGGLLRGSANSDAWTKESALAGIYHCLKAGKRLGKCQKG